MHYDVIKKRPVLATLLLFGGIIDYWLLQEAWVWKLLGPLIDPLCLPKTPSASKTPLEPMIWAGDEFS